MRARVRARARVACLLLADGLPGGRCLCFLEGHELLELSRLGLTLLRGVGVRGVGRTVYRSERGGGRGERGEG